MKNFREKFSDEKSMALDNLKIKQNIFVWKLGDYQ